MDLMPFFERIAPHITAENVVSYGTPVLVVFGASVAIQKVKKWAGVANERVMVFLQAALAFIVTLCDQIFNAAPSLATMGNKWSIAMATMTVVYHLPFIGVKSLSIAMNDARAERERKARLAASQPIEGTATVTTPSPAIVTSTVAPKQPQTVDVLL